MEHTKGPWFGKVSTDCVGELTTDIMGANRYDIASDVDNEANVQLIIAAPELLEACQIMVEHCAELFGPEDEDIVMLEAAINKATT